MSPRQQLREAITAARAGNRSQARELFLELVEQEPRNETAWLWLSDLVEDVEDQIIALENALTLNPNRPKVQTRLEQLRQQQQAQSPALPPEVQPPPTPQSDFGLWGTGEVIEEESRPPVQESFLPGAVEEMEELAEDENLVRGRAYEAEGELEKAMEAYKEAAARAPLNADRLIAKKRMRAIKPQLRQAQIKHTAPTTTVLRLAAGPPVLYGFLILVHSGLNPLSLSPFLCLGGVAVVLGSLLMASIQHLPQHELLQSLLGGESLDDRATSVLVRALALLVMLTPFLLFLASAMNRLDVYRASFSVTLPG